MAILLSYDNITNNIQDSRLRRKHFEQEAWEDHEFVTWNLAGLIIYGETAEWLIEIGK